LQELSIVTRTSSLTRHPSSDSVATVNVTGNSIVPEGSGQSLQSIKSAGIHV
jgi:hypothetical protein